MEKRKTETSRDPVNMVRRIGQGISVAVGAGAAIVLVLTLGHLFTRYPPRLTERWLEEAGARSADLLEKQGLAIAKLDRRVDALARPSSSLPPNAEVAQMRTELDEIKRRVDSIENAILADPEKALAVPLLRRDLNVFERSYHRDMEGVAKQIDRVYDQNKWFVGLMFTMAVGLTGLAVSNFVQLRQASKSGRDGSGSASSPSDSDSS